MTRDYVAEMDARIDAATSGDGWVAGIVAAELHADLTATDPDLLSGWLHASAEHWLQQTIRDRSRSTRAHARHHAGAHQFADAADDPETLRGMLSVDYVIDDSQTRKRAGDMTGPDHRYVANSYTATGNRALLLAEFHVAVARKVGKRRTSDVLSLDQYENLYRSITGMSS